jgi:DNA replication protein DnaC/primosomal protein DnaI
VVVIPVGEQDIPAYTDEVGRRHAAIKVPAGLSPLLLAFMRQAICAECIDAEDAELARNRASDDFARRVAKSGLTGAMVKEFSKGWEDIIVRGRSADDGARRREVLAAAQDWAQVVGESARGLWLHGPAGSGKTRLLGTAVVEKLRHTTVRWVNVAVLVMQLDMAWADADRQAALKVLTDPGVVVLDDLDKVPPSERARMALFTALEARDKAGAGICVSSNSKPSELADAFSSPFMSRLVKLANPMPYPGADMRLEMVR